MIRPKLMTADELQEGYRWVIDQVYSLSSITKRCLKSFECTNPIYSLALNIAGKLDAHRKG